MTDTIKTDMLLGHGNDCPAFYSATITKGVPANGAAVVVSAGQVQLPSGTVEFRNRSTGALLASMPATVGATLNQSVGACVVNVTPDALRSLIAVQVWSDSGVAQPFRGFDVEPFTGIRRWGAFD